MRQLVPFVSAALFAVVVAGCGAADPICGDQLGHGCGAGTGGGGGDDGGGEDDGYGQRCQAACDHLANCGAALGVNRGDCYRACHAESIDEATIACFSVVQCTLQAFYACNPIPASAACVAACAHVYDDCGHSLGNPGFDRTTCERICTDDADATAELTDCLAGYDCTDAGLRNCFLL
ncbi:hypothetical protein [Vulgatibacter sp.]|uniref:hypothetical protein n=1 Tax=Vulgatibacter sp. TaxID=1971226 RepID=UPI0035630B01